MKKGLSAWIIIGVIIIVLAGIGIYFLGKNAGRNEFLPEEKELPENTSQIDAMAENILQSINNNDYLNFVKDFSSNLKLIMNEQTFQETKNLLNQTSGVYVSKKKPGLYTYQGLDLYSYPCVFEKEQVTLSIYLDPDSILIEGITFDSENLREVAQ